jgi:hypothetical protein
MIENMVIPNLPVDTQQRLFDLFQRSNNVAGLSRLAALPDLAPEVDAKIAQVTIGTVRAKWMSRPGRPSEDVYANLKREQRVGVLVELVDVDLEQETYEVIAKANKSHTLALAILKDDKPGKRAREIAARNLGEYVSATTKDSKLFAIKEAIAANPEVYENFAETVHCWSGARVALQGGPYKGKTASTLEKFMLDELTRLGEMATEAERHEQERQAAGRQQYYYNQSRYALQQQLQAFLSVLGDVDASWLKASTRDTISTTLVSFSMRCKAIGFDIGDEISDTVATLTVSERSTQLHKLVGGVQDAETLEAALEALDGCELFRGSARYQIVSSLLRNKNLSFSEMLAAYGYVKEHGGDVSSPWKLVKDIEPELYKAYPANGILLCEAIAPWYVSFEKIREAGREREYLETIVDAVRDGAVFGRNAIGYLLESSLLDEKMVEALPCKVLYERSSVANARAISLFGAVLARELATVPVSGLEQFERLVENFTGTIRELAAVCQAATAVN